MSRRTFKYRLYPHRQQREKLQATLDVCRELYNAALQERREAWSLHRKGIHYLEQANQLPDIKAVREDIRAVHSQVLQDTLRRIDKAFQAFFLRCQRGQVATETGIPHPVFTFDGERLNLAADRTVQLNLDVANLRKRQAASQLEPGLRIGE